MVRSEKNMPDADVDVASHAPEKKNDWRSGPQPRLSVIECHQERCRDRRCQLGIASQISQNQVKSKHRPAF